MRVLVLGADGFIGRIVRKVVARDHEVYASNRNPRAKGSDIYIDLLRPVTIAKALKDIKPEAIINCAGIVENSEEANKNVLFTSNLLQEALASGLKFKNIFISGSAAEYGLVDKANIPVNETTPLNANSGYGLSKLKESAKALEYRNKHKLPVAVGRIFNPIGMGMHQRFIIPGIMRQIEEIKNGGEAVISVSRLDSKRDYIDVADIAGAIKILIEGTPKQSVYNIGSGKSTSNQELIKLILKNSSLPTRLDIKETAETKEPLVAIQADISRMKNEFGWAPKRPIEETIKEIVYDAR